MTPALRVAHYVSLRGSGGVERHFSRFLEHTAGREDVRQYAVVCSRNVHPHHRPYLRRAAGIRYEKRRFGLRVPRRWRDRHYRWIADTIRPDVALLWNRMGQQRRVLEVLGPERCLYWAHGSSWLPGEEREKAYLARHARAAICNSHATRRMLELRWNFRGQLRVSRCGLPAPARPAAAYRKSFPRGRTVRIGVAGRLTAMKGTALAVHALQAIRAAGLDAELHIAGDGAERRSLQALAASLRLDRSVRFRGLVADMDAFFREVDCLLHPALREPFGLVAIEAGARGCPVVCTRVDGLPETVAHGRTGYCVPPALPLARYPRFGGRVEGLPPLVYDPDEDRVGPPRFCAPEDLADAMLRLFAEPAAYERVSATAAEEVPRRFALERHAREVLDHARAFAETGSMT